ncbi:hypothetical protein PY650_33700 [Rhizobium calliandrae]|uniref:DUF805 domain-containing protein n=1 Tax=Rhizobium calliandrae TaxID=1312182 RepID=A0ABT7KPE1_9HYPH|nr:hypothetical protein [Rhizobium calliandrae]MDL2410452.1 hypothetical protein [Rhizobium calliandrae]
MIDSLFCFRGRVGRLRFFLYGFIIVPVAFFLMFLFLPALYVFGLHLDASRSTTLMAVVPPVAGFFWMQLSIQAARIRDIGWKPGVIIPALLLIDVADLIVAYLFPALALETKHFTALSEVVNAIFTIALLFTPSDGDQAAPTIVFPEIPLPRFRKGIRRARSDGATAVQPSLSPSGMLRSADVRGQQSFGRRGLD